ncbi:MAG: 4Fe-4S dicluster domain-containing protein [Anaerolineae bacterium]|nr:4Fe-4S dicluster domain-containing protein [Anaerolineae bacterium]
MASPSNGPEEDFLSLVSGLRGGERVVACYQCGTCSGSCPAVAAMDYPPRALMHLIRLNRAETVLSSRAIWVCAACYACTVRCPRDIEITDLMASLRSLAVERGYAPRDASFDRAFLNLVKRDGRMFELELLLRYNLLRPVDLVRQAPVGLMMLRRRKLTISPHRIDDHDQVGAIFCRWEEGK